MMLSEEGKCVVVMTETCDGGAPIVLFAFTHTTGIVFRDSRSTIPTLLCQGVILHTLGSECLERGKMRLFKEKSWGGVEP